MVKINARIRFPKLFKGCLSYFEVVGSLKVSSKIKIIFKETYIINVSIDYSYLKSLYI